MALDDIYQLIDNQLTIEGVNVVNVYFYERLDPAGTALDCIGAFEEDVLPTIALLQNEDITHTELVAINLGDLTDFATKVVNVDGAGQGDRMATFNAINFTLRGNSRAVRPGAKRISGLAESAAIDGVVSEANYINAVEAVRLKLFAEIQDTGGTSAYRPVLIKRVPYTTSSGRPGYRLPESGAELVVVPITTALSNLRISSQVSRK